MTSFPCEKCGACCRVMKCDRLKDNLCTIYETRPDICNVETMAKKRNMDSKTAYAMNKRACLELRRSQWNR